MLLWTLAALCLNLSGLAAEINPLPAVFTRLTTFKRYSVNW